MSVDPLRSCYSKRVYPSEPTAQTAVAKILADRGVYLRTYLCDECNGWHLTKTAVNAPTPKPGWRPPERKGAWRERQMQKRRR